MIHDRLWAGRLVAHSRLPSWLAPATAFALALLAGGLAVRFGVFAAAGADAYGYVSQADLWAQRTLRVAQPAVLQLPGLVTDEMVAPLGYRPARRVGLPGGIVPTYPAGLPMLMALARVTAGPRAVFLVVPVLAALTVWLAFVAGRRLAGPRAGLVAALLLLASPAFIAGALRPMSDLPAAAWWTLALVAATAGHGWGWGALSGTATSLAILTRPNLAPLGLVVALPLLQRVVANAKSKDLTPWVFAVTAAAGPLAVALINAHLYGSPLESGYGRLDDIYAIEHMVPNLRRYLPWLVTSQSPLVLVAIMAPLMLGTATAWLYLAFVAATVAVYLPYLEFEHWTYLRFLLPAYPAMLALVAATLALVSSRLPRAWGWAGTVAIVAGLTAHGWIFVARDGVLRWAADEQRYVTMGRFVATSLPPDAIVLAMQHSGSARYYSGRLTLRYDLIEPAQLDPVLTGLTAAGFRPFLLLESWEEDRFRELFAGTSAWGDLDWPPMAETEASPIVRVYDVRDRDRARGGVTIDTRVVPTIPRERFP